MIELLVVVAIISLLSSIILASLNSARAKARDARRAEDIHQIQLALNLYYNDHGVFPESYTGGAQSPNGYWDNSNDATSWVQLQTALAPYIPSLPHDPKESSTSWPAWGGYSYTYFSTSKSGGYCNQQMYELVYLPEVSGRASPGVSCAGTTYNFAPAVTVGESSQ